MVFFIIIFFSNSCLSAPTISETIVFIIEKLPLYGVVPFSNDLSKEKIKIDINTKGKLELDDDRWSEFYGYGNRVKINFYLQHVKVVTTDKDFGGVVFMCRNNKKCINKWYYGEKVIKPTPAVHKNVSSTTIAIFDKQERTKLVRAFYYLITLLPEIDDYSEDRIERFFEKDKES